MERGRVSILTSLRLDGRSLDVRRGGDNVGAGDAGEEVTTSSRGTLSRAMLIRLGLSVLAEHGGGVSAGVTANWVLPGPGPRLGRASGWAAKAGFGLGRCRVGPVPGWVGAAWAAGEERPAPGQGSRGSGRSTDRREAGHADRCGQSELSAHGAHGGGAVPRLALP